MATLLRRVSLQYHRTMFWTFVARSQLLKTGNLNLVLREEMQNESSY